MHYATEAQKPNKKNKFITTFPLAVQSLNPDIQTLVFCSALRGGSEENFNYLWEMYLRSTDSGQQSILLNALGCTSNEERRTL